MSSSSSSFSSSEEGGAGWDQVDWKQLPTNVKDAAKLLGYTQGLWDNDVDPSSCDRWWKELSPEEMDAAKLIGYTEESWNSDSDDDSDSDDESKDEDPPNVVCVQIFVETDDYVLRVGELGVTMYANREMGADEVFFNHRVGPTKTNLRIFASHDGRDLTRERRAFMRRFLEWQEKHGNKPDVGASQVERPLLASDDFRRKGKVRCSNPEPTPSNPTYNFELRENDFCVVEFVPDPDRPDSTTLPDARRFEVLPYDEAIYWDGEEDYDAERCGRPPSVWKCDRTLELPGHFSNHACGSHATVYDTFRLRRSTDTDGGTSGVVAPAQPEEVQKELEDYVSTKTFPRSMEENVMTTYRPMKKGDEVTTDYALWHWSNADYCLDEPDRKKILDKMNFGENPTLCITTAWDELPMKARTAASYLGFEKSSWDGDRTKPAINKMDWNDLSLEMQVAALTLGYDQVSWDEKEKKESSLIEGKGDDMDPWFNCICGSPECHSKNGFRGVASFSDEEQKRLYLVCSLWIQNNIDWKNYHTKKNGVCTPVPQDW